MQVHLPFKHIHICSLTWVKVPDSADLSALCPCLCLHSVTSLRNRQGSTQRWDNLSCTALYQMLQSATYVGPRERRGGTTAYWLGLTPPHRVQMCFGWNPEKSQTQQNPKKIENTGRGQGLWRFWKCHTLLVGQKWWLRGKYCILYSLYISIGSICCTVQLYYMVAISLVCESFVFLLPFVVLCFLILHLFVWDVCTLFFDITCCNS